MPLHALELVPDEAGLAAVRQDWQRLSDAGLPSQLDHRGPTNAPHLTLVAAPDLDARACAAAVELLGPLMPVRVRASGLLLLGGTRPTLARAVDVDDAVVAAVLAVRRLVPGLPHRGWLPHLTLARRLARADVQRAVDSLGAADQILTMTVLRRWNPDERAVRHLVETPAD